MRKFLTALFAALLVAVVGLPISAQAARVNTLIKGSGSTIYWAANDGKKYSFPNIDTYYTWFSSTDLKTVKKISDKELKSIPTGGNVVFRGGAKLVKFPTEATVYAVSRYGVLRPILSGDVAAQIYGQNWTNEVRTIPWNLRSDYRIGSMIRVAYTDYSASQEYNGVSTPSDNLQTATVFVPNLPASTLNGTLSLALTNRLYTPDRAQFTATLSNSNRDANQLTIQIKNETRNEIIQTCYASYTCSATWYVDTVATQDIVALVKDASGYSLGSNHVAVQGLNNSSLYSNYSYSYPYTNYSYTTPNYYNYYGYGSVGTVALSLSNTSVYTNDQVTAYVETKNYTIPTNRLLTEIYVDGTRIGSCQGTVTCSLTFNNPTGNVTRQVYARVSDNSTNVVESARQTVYVNDRTNYYGNWSYGNQSTFWADARLTAEWTNDRKIRLTGRINDANRTASYVSFSIVDRYTNQVLKNCNGFDSCSIDVTTDSNTYDVNHYAVIASDWNGNQLNYVYAPAIGTNPYAYNNYTNYNYNYNGYYYGTPSVNTNAYRYSYNTWAPTFTIEGTVTSYSTLNNTRLEIYAIDNTYGGSPRLINTCYGVATCTTQDTPSLTYGTVSYFTVFVDGNGIRTNSATKSS